MEFGGSPVSIKFNFVTKITLPLLWRFAGAAQFPNDDIKPLYKPRKCDMISTGLAITSSSSSVWIFIFGGVASGS
jgi:hypothetical protein